MGIRYFTMKLLTPLALCGFTTIHGAKDFGGYDMVLLLEKEIKKMENKPLEFAVDTTEVEKSRVSKELGRFGRSVDKDNNQKESVDTLIESSSGALASPGPLSSFVIDENGKKKKEQELMSIVDMIADDDTGFFACKWSLVEQNPFKANTEIANKT